MDKDQILGLTQKLLNSHRGDPALSQGLAEIQRQAEQLIREIKEQDLIQSSFTLIFDAVGQGILQVGSDGLILRSNRVVQEMFGYKEQELCNQPVEILVPRAHRNAHQTLRKEFIAGSEPDRKGPGRELWGLHKNGTLVPVEIGLKRIRHEESTHIIVSIADITERKRQQQEMLDKTRSLERSNEELKDFTYIATHDLKEPLRGISNYAMFLLEDYEPFLDAEGKEMIHSIVRLSGRMEQYISELLNFSRVGQMQLHLNTVNLTELAQEAVDALAPRLGALKVSVEIDSLPSVPCDRVLVRQVFLNLISNAMKYNDKDTKWIRVACEIRNGRRVFLVQDNGIGIPRPFFDRIFKIFKRLHAQDRYEGGTGVGLAIVKKIIERHGGEVWLESEEGSGTTFFFTLG